MTATILLNTKFISIVWIWSSTHDGSWHIGWSTQGSAMTVRGRRILNKQKVEHNNSIRPQICSLPPGTKSQVSGCTTLIAQQGSGIWGSPYLVYCCARVTNGRQVLAGWRKHWWLGIGVVNRVTPTLAVLLRRWVVYNNTHCNYPYYSLASLFLPPPIMLGITVVMAG